MSNFAIYALWFVLPPLQVAIAYRMWRQKAYRDYPLFFVYTLEQLVRFAILFFYYAQNLRACYNHAYAGLQAIEAILQIGIVLELSSDAFRPYEGIRQIGPSLLRWAGIFFLFAAILVAVYSTGADSYKFLGQLFAMERSVEIVQAGLLLLLAGASSLLALEWKPQTLWIAMGFGLFTSVNLIAYTVRFQSGMSSQQTLSLFSNAAYTCAVLFWVRAFYSQPKEANPAGLQPAQWDVQSWNRALSQLLRR
jgi:hypothetical protein